MHKQTVVDRAFHVGYVVLVSLDDSNFVGADDGGASAEWGCAEKNPHVVMHTQLGDIEMELDAVHAPATTANFLRYVKGGFYTGGLFHRTVTMQNQPDSPVKIEVIQGGINPERKKDGFPAIALERTSVTGLKHVDGAVSMARGGPDSATSDFFVCIGDQPELDFGGKRNADGQGFAAFGRVVRGMDVVRKIQRSPVQGQKLTPGIGIVSADLVGGK
jgi:peptidyl-prolyl cis-trans isomerase A (cyclophilin A)